MNKQRIGEKIMNKNLLKMVDKVGSVLSTNKTTILTGLAVTGVVTTFVFAYRAGIKAKDILEKRKQDLADVKVTDTAAKRAVNKECAKTLIPLMLPSIVFGGLTIACVLASHTASNRKIAALSAAYSISESALGDLNAKMQEMLGEKKTRAIKDAIAKDKVHENPPDPAKVIVTGNGNVLCMDGYSGRYFESTVEKIRQTFLSLSTDVQSEMFVSLNDFYAEVGLPQIPLGDDLGWGIDHTNRGLIEFDLVTILTEDDRPCVVIEYDAHPRFEHGREWY